MGNEVKGVQQEVIDHSDGCIEIPQYGTETLFECFRNNRYCDLGFVQKVTLIAII